MFISEPVQSSGSVRLPDIWSTTEQKYDGEKKPCLGCYLFLSLTLFLCDVFIPNLLTIIARQADNWCFESLLTGFSFLYV